MRTIIGIILFGIGVGLAAFVAWPQWDRIEFISGDTERIRALGVELDGLIKRRDELLAKRAAIDPSVLAKLDAIARLGGPNYTRVTKESIFGMPRPVLPPA